MLLFYTENISENQAVFEADEARHISQSLRKNQGESIRFVDGNGNLYKGEISLISKKQVIVDVISKEHKPTNDLGIHIAIAPTKNMDRIEWFVEKSIELGIKEISFIQCKHSERKIIKSDRIKRIAVAAMKQSLKASLPALSELTPFENWVKDAKEEQKFIAYLGDSTSELRTAYNAHQSVCIAIGPEGGFRDSEVKFALDHGFKAVSLGDERLRTETAGLFAVASFRVL